MRERPILFSAPMVRAILGGRKTQTRRTLKVSPPDDWAPAVDWYHPTKVGRDGEEYPGEKVFGASDETFAVRAERLQDITEEDAKAEGVTPFPKDPEGDCWTDGKHRTAFEHLWGEINGWQGPKSWDKNPWLWVIGFRRLDDDGRAG